MYRLREFYNLPLYKAQTSYIFVYRDQIFERKCIPKVWLSEKPGLEDVLRFFCLENETPSILDEGFVWAADILDIARKVLDEAQMPASEEGHYDTDNYVADILFKLGFQEIGTKFKHMDKWFA